MTTIGQPVTHLPQILHADRAIRSGERFLHHAQVELANDVHAVMATVTPAETLTWMDGWAWSAPTVAQDGTVKFTVNTEQEGIRDYYLTSRQRYQLRSFRRPSMHLCSDWYSLIETRAQFDSVADAQPYEQQWVQFAPMDGEQGIPGEMAWGRFPHLEPGDAVTEDDRLDVYGAYLEALRNHEVDGLLAVMSDGVQGAVRDYGADGAFVHIDGAQQMRAYYQRLFTTMRIHAVDAVRFVDRGWYMFSELRWQVELTTGPNTGRKGSLLVGEILALGPDGLLYSRTGFGTSLLD